MADPQKKDGTSESAAPPKAPDAVDHPAEEEPRRDYRLWPGGARGMPGPTGMAAFDREPFYK
jgi:hypothetical protein